MTQQFTASEVRDWERAYKGTGAAKVFGAYADRLEVDEKAVPVAYALFTEKGLIRMWSRDWFADAHGAPVNPTPLYAHPAPADAERLAEALRDDEHEWPASLNIRDTKLHDDMGGPGQRIYTTAGRGYKTMKYIRHDLAHSAQAQPPAASVTDAMVGRAQDCLHDKGKDIGYYHMRAALEAALAAQTQPPARTCSDERPCVNCFADQGGCLGPAPETVRQRKEQRAVEIAAAISTRHEFSRHESPLILDIVRATLTAQENSNG